MRIGQMDYQSRCWIARRLYSSEELLEEERGYGQRDNRTGHQGVFCETCAWLRARDEQDCAARM